MTEGENEQAQAQHCLSSKSSLFKGNQEKEEEGAV